MEFPPIIGTCCCLFYDVDAALPAPILLLVYRLLLNSVLNCSKLCLDGCCIGVNDASYYYNAELLIPSLPDSLLVGTYKGGLTPPIPAFDMLSF